MRIFSKGTLRTFWEDYPDARSALEFWYDTVENIDFETPNEVTNPGYYIKKFIIPENTLAKGTYYIKFDVGSHNYMGIYQGTLLSFSLMNRGNLGCRFPVGSQMNFSGLFRPKWSIEK